MKLKDDVSADLADSQKVDEEDRKSDDAALVAALEHEVATAATIETILRQGDLGVDPFRDSKKSVASSEIWLREDL